MMPIEIRMIRVTLFSTLIALMLTSCGMAGKKESDNGNPQESADSVLRTGADQTEAYLPLLEGKRVGLMGNQTSVVGSDNEHLVDVLMANDVDLRFGFAPEHGFRGEIERGEKVSNETDEKTGLPRSEEHTSELQSRENLVC